MDYFISDTTKHEETITYILLIRYLIKASIWGVGNNRLDDKKEG